MESFRRDRPGGFPRHRRADDVPGLPRASGLVLSRSPLLLPRPAGAPGEGTRVGERGADGTGDTRLLCPGGGALEGEDRYSAGGGKVRGGKEEGVGDQLCESGLLPLAIRKARERQS